jgi:Tfp pilus assembly protein FimT
MLRLPFPRGFSRRAVTLAELVVVVTIVWIVCGIGLPPLKRGYDRLETRSAAQDGLMAFFVGRSAAVASGRPTDVVIDGPRGLVLVINGADTMLTEHPGRKHGVSVSATRSRTTYTAAGLGYGGANLSVVLSRGSASETLFVSREGRVKLGARGR